MTRRDGAVSQVVLVWRNDVLHGSETFIRNQVDATRRWRAILTGARRWNSVLSTENDEILFGSSVVERIRRMVFLATGRSARVDRLIRDQGVSVIHAHFATSAATIFRTARRHGIPLIVTVHGFDVTDHEMRRGRGGARYVRRTRRVFRYASRVVAVSDFIATQTIEAFGVDPQLILMLPIGVPALPQTVPVPARKKRDLLFVGRLVEKKGVADLLSALSALAAEGAHPTLAIIGDGPLRAVLEAQTQAGGLAVEFLGALPPSRVAEEMANSTIFVAPSRTAASGDAEGFGLVFLEAARAGIPAIAYRHGGVPEAVVDGQTGILVDEGDVGALAAAIAELLSDEGQRGRMGLQASDRVRAEYDIEQCTDRLVALYDEVARVR